ncbi:MAG: TrmB family transcriptional regulator [Patescibacteria group bacterium]
MKRIITYLQKLGLSELEAKIYYGLLETGSTTVMELANHVGIKRITTHFNVERLIEMGLVAETKKGARRKIVAEDPDKLEHLLLKKEEEIQSLKQSLPKLMQSLSEMNGNLTQSAKNVRILYYEGEKGFKDVSQRSLDYAEDEILFLSSLSSWHQVYTSEYDKNHYIPKRLEKNIALKLLIPVNEKDNFTSEENEKINREVRYLPEVSGLKSTFIVYKGEVSIMLSAYPYTAIVIQDKDLSDSFRKLFGQLWEHSMTVRPQSPFEDAQ